MKSKLATFDILSAVKASSLVTSVLPSDSLAELLVDYRVLRGMASAKVPTKYQQGYYQSCVEVIDVFPIHLFRRNLALLLVWAGNLYRLEYRSFPEFALQRAGLKNSQAHKACANALMTLIFDNAGKRHLMPVGDMEEALVKLLPDHWLTAWEQVLSTTSEGNLDIDHVKATLHNYCQEHPSALPHRRTLETRLLPPIVTVSGNDEQDEESVHPGKLRTFNATLLESPLAAQLAHLAATHKRSPASFALEALRTLPVQSETELPEPDALLRLLQEIDPAVAKRAKHVASSELLTWIAQAGLRRHNYLEKRRAEYQRRRARQQALKKLPDLRLYTGEPSNRHSKR